MFFFFFLFFFFYHFRMIPQVGTLQLCSLPSEHSCWFWLFLPHLMESICVYLCLSGSLSLLLPFSPGTPINWGSSPPPWEYQPLSPTHHPHPSLDPPKLPGPAPFPIRLSHWIPGLVGLPLAFPMPCLSLTAHLPQSYTGQAAKSCSRSHAAPQAGSHCHSWAFRTHTSPSAFQNASGRRLWFLVSVIS